MNLGTLLLRNGAIRLSDLETALKHQLLYGGKLGSNLVELELIEIDTLNQYLAELLGVPAASDAMLAAAPRDMLDAVGEELATRLRCIPLGMIDGELAVAMADPKNDAAVDELVHALGCKFITYVMPEMRYVHFLELHYGVTRPARFVRSGTATDEADDARRSVRPADGRAAPPVATIFPRRHQVTMPAPLRAKPKGTFAEAAARMASATSREQIAEVFLAYGQGRCDAILVLMVRDGYALGWRGWTSAPTSSLMWEELAIPLGVASALQHVNDRRTAYWGPPVGLGRTEEPLWRAAGLVPASMVAVVPVLFQSVVGNIVYAHEADENTCAGLAELAQSAGAAYGRLAVGTRK